MNKTLAVLVALLAITPISVAAHAGGSTTKKVTLTCSSILPDVISADATVSLCETTSPICTGQVVTCPALACDSAANPSESTACTAPFKVNAVKWTETFSDTDGSSGGDSNSRLLAKGKFPFVQVQVSTNDASDTAVLTVK